MDRFYFTYQQRVQGVHVAERFKLSGTALCGVEWHKESSRRPLGLVTSLESIKCEGCRTVAREILEQESDNE